MGKRKASITRINRARDFARELDGRVAHRGAILRPLRGCTRPPSGFAVQNGSVRFLGARPWPGGTPVWLPQHWL